MALAFPRTSAALQNLLLFGFWMQYSSTAPYPHSTVSVCLSHLLLCKEGKTLMLADEGLL